jgi:hypothetical protein
MRRAGPAAVSGPCLEIGVPAKGFEPGMAVGVDSVVFEQLALERLCLRELRRECWIAPVGGNPGSEQAHPPTRIVGEDREDFRPSLRISALRRQRTERGESTPLGADIEAGLSEGRQRRIRDVRSGNRKPVAGPEP